MISSLSFSLIEFIRPVTHDPISWMRHVLCEVGLKELDATWGDTRYDFSLRSFIILKLIPHLPYEMTPYIALLISSYKFLCIIIVYVIIDCSHTYALFIFKTMRADEIVFF